jgi:hypothetical protein
MNDVINKPRISKWIGRMYVVLTLLVAILYIAIAFGTRIGSAPLSLQLLFSGIMLFILLLLTLVVVSFYRTRYVISDGVLHAWSPFAIINLKLSDIKKVRTTLIPIHIRVGAGLYSGRFYVPGFGWTRSIITNLTDGVLITAKGNKHYLITPSNPDKFAGLLNNR